MALSIYQYAQLGCPVETLAFGLSLLCIGRSKVKDASWLCGAKVAVAIVLLVATVIAAAQCGLSLYHKRLSVDIALCLSQLYLATFVLSAAIKPLAPTRRMLRPLLVFCLVVIWISVGLTGVLHIVLVVVSVIVYTVEMVRITSISLYYYHQFSQQPAELNEDERSRLAMIDLFTKAIILLFFSQLLYLAAVLWADSLKLVPVAVMMCVWGFLFVSCVNLVINYDQVNIAPDQPVTVESNDIPHLPPPHSELAVKVDRWIKMRRYTVASLTLKAAAKDMDTNRTYLSQFINSRYGCSFSVWIMGLRLAEAKRLMVSSPTLSLEQVSHTVGFSSLSYFIKSFKQVEGISPGQWRKLNG